jgi:hypothetical protein
MWSFWSLLVEVVVLVLLVEVVVLADCLLDTLALLLVLRIL